MIEREKVIELIKSGLSDSDIADKLKAGRTTIWRIRNETKMRGEIIKLRKDKVSIRDIADKLGIDKNKVWRMLKDNTMTSKTKPKNKLCTIRFKGTITYYK